MSWLIDMTEDPDSKSNWNVIHGKVLICIQPFFRADTIAFEENQVDSIDILYYCMHVVHRAI